jgi:dihydromonapterin reductase/dihydrofolate reductase
VTADPTLITGVGKRTGFHIAREFLQRGMPVIGTYRTWYPRLDELERLGADLYHCDFDRQDEVELLIREIKTRHERLRGIIHNASDWLCDDEGFPAGEVIERMMRIHANVPYQLNHELAPLLQACNDTHADIIHIGDYVSSQGSKKHIAYAASKAAQDNLTLSFAAKLAPKVKVNSLAPALIKFNEHDDPDYRKKAAAKSLMQREGGWDEMQRAIDYLFASQYVTGRVLPLDGGRHLK